MTAGLHRPVPRDVVVSVVIPCRNEEGAIGSALRAVLSQSYGCSRMEVVVVDGGSSDGSVAEAEALLDGCDLRRWAVLSNERGSTPSNLNHGLAWAEGDVVVRVDARSHIPQDYVERVVSHLGDEGVAVVGGRQVARARSRGAVDVGIARALNNRYGMGLARYRRGRGGEAAVDTVYLGAFRRAQLVATGGWDERFETNQDFELNRRLRSQGVVRLDGDLAVDYVPRRSLPELFSQYHRFGRWKVRYWSLTGDRPRPRQVVLLVGPLPVAAAAALVVRHAPLPALLLSTATAALVEGVGSSGPAGGIRPRVVAVTALGGVAAGWWSGVVRQTVLHVLARHLEPADASCAR